MEQHICKYCGKIFDSGIKLGGHTAKCKMNPNANKNFEIVGNKKTLTAKFTEYDILCPVCGKYKQLRLSLNSYEKGKYKKTCSLECAHKLTVQNTNKNIKNEHISTTFLTKEKILHTRICACCGKEFIVENKSKYCSSACMIKTRHEKLSNLAKQTSLGGYNKNSIKKHHHGDYNGFHYDSSWELAFIVYCLEHNIKIERCNETRYYIINDVKKRYFPDFIVDGKIIEIKGYFDKISQIKSIYNPDVLILLKKDLQPYLEYVQIKYGKNFWEILK